MTRGQNTATAAVASALVALPLFEPTSDRGDEVQRAFRYQSAYGVILMIEGCLGTIDLKAIWCEHHEDLLVEQGDGYFLACQVKTRAERTGHWKNSDSDFRKSLRRFHELESTRGEYIVGYRFVSNCPPFSPTARATKPETICSSPLKLLEAVGGVSTPSAIQPPFKDTFDELVAELLCDGETLLAVLKRLDFVLGPSLSDYEDVLVARYVPRIPTCSALLVPALAGLRDELIEKIWKASALSADASGLHVCAIGLDGRPVAEKLAKRVSLDDLHFVVSERSVHLFRYSPKVLQVEYGSGKSKMDKLRKKMEAGGVGQHYDYIEAKAIATEASLFEQASLNPTDALARLGHLEHVVLSECHEANIDVGALPKDSRGIKMLQEVVARLRTLAAQERTKVENQPYEVLVGLAGLLSGECKIWWGIPVDPGELS